MRAAVFDRYGPPGVVHLGDVVRPVPRDNEILIRVGAASVNPLDCITQGKPYSLRMMTGLRRPRNTRLGVDVAGQVEAAGRDVTRFRPGDQVFGLCRRDPLARGAAAWLHCQGAFAEYACVPERAAAAMPGNITPGQAAAVPVAALTALQGLRDRGKIRPGHQVLINGAAGGVGTFAVQIAKSFGAEVTGVCSTRNAGLVRSLGADRVLDYTREDFTATGDRYDVFFDLVGNHPLAACRRDLKPHLTGTFKLSSGPLLVGKVVDVAGRSHNPPERAVVLCVNEKPGIQTLDRSRPVPPMMPGTPGTPGRRSHDYVRHGTTGLFAAFSIADGTAISSRHRRHRAAEFKKFPARTGKAVPAGLDVHLVCDNLAAHKTPEIRARLARHPRFRLHVTPTGSSWINQVGRWPG